MLTNNVKIAKEADKNNNVILNMIGKGMIKTALKYSKILSRFCLQVNKSAFTLAEVLITLGIIGIVAAMTLPALIQKQQEKSTVVGLKKFYSTIQQAYQLTVEEGSDPSDWGLTDDLAGSQKIAGKFAKHLKIAKDCGVGKGCFIPGSELDNRNDKLYKYRLHDGTSLAIGATKNCELNNGDTRELKNICGWFVFDVNGDKRPNMYGMDTFEFYITKYNILPYGVDGDTKFPFNSSFVNTTNSHQYTAWVIINENQDYLHCNDLSWSGKTKCTK